MSVTGFASSSEVLGLVDCCIKEFSGRHPEFTSITAWTVLGPRPHNPRQRALDSDVFLLTKDLAESVHCALTHLNLICYTEIFVRIYDAVSLVHGVDQDPGHSTITASDVISSKLILDLTIRK